MKNISCKQDYIFVIVVYLLLVIALIATLYPMLFVLSASISDPTLVSTGKVWLLPKGITFDGYKRIFQKDAIWTGYRNSIMYTILGTAINLAITLPAAYALSRKDTPFRGFFSKIFLFTMFFSGGIIPMYVLIRSLNMRDTIWAVILPAGCSTYNLIVTRTFFMCSIPDELEEAAEIDGCTIFQLFFKIVLPLSASIIAVMALLYGVGHWNSYFNAMIYLSNRELFPLQVILRELLIVQAADQTQALTKEVAESLALQSRMAEMMKYGIMVVATVPVLLVYPIVQKYFVKGVMIGALKG